VFALVLAALPFAGAAGAALSALAVQAGCDGEASFDIPPVDAGAPPAVYHAACEAWATAYCAYQAACPTVYAVFDKGVCVPRNTLRCEIIASDPNVAFDPVRVAACGAPDAANCDQPAGDLCLPPGRGAIGAPCLASEACQSGVCAVSYSYGQGSACGTCQGKFCDGGCPTGLRCGLEPEGGIGCVKVLAVGDTCSTSLSCETSYCGPDGKCGALAKLDAGCSNEGTTAPLCADVNAFCSDKKVCSLVTAAGYGEPCAPQGDAAYQCTGYGTCDYANNVCIPPAADGEFCDEMQGLNCAPPAVCDHHRCLFPNLARCKGS
jgi:hypothetical protein